MILWFWTELWNYTQEDEWFPNTPGLGPTSLESIRLLRKTDSQINPRSIELEFGGLESGKLHWIILICNQDGEPWLQKWVRRMCKVV